MSADKIPAKNSVQVLPEGIILLTQTGYQTAESISMFQARIDDMTVELHQQGRKVLILADVRKVTGQDSEVLKLAKERLKGDYDALAIVGTAAPIRMIVNWIISAAGNDQRLKAFDKYEDALTWLLSHNA